MDYFDTFILLLLPLLQPWFNFIMFDSKLYLLIQWTGNTLSQNDDKEIKGVIKEHKTKVIRLL
tara:strand:- start:1479 stop:1667 length:189 start_codon:yes stop_codon:yes gene_type:complete